MDDRVAAAAERLANDPRLKREAIERLCRHDPAAWARFKRGFVNADFHREWYDLLQRSNRLCVVAPREHAKTEVFTVNQTAWRSLYQPGIWTYIFAATADQAMELKSRIDDAVEEADASMVERSRSLSKTQSVYRNLSRVTVAGVGKRIRGAHPDVIIGDDVLDEDSTATRFQRERMRRYWAGTVGGMAHPGSWRNLDGQKKWFEPTRIFLVGTPFHHDDLLLGMRSNPVYSFRRYAAEADPSSFVPGTKAVEVA